MTSIEARFEKFVERVPISGCWIWHGAIRGHGYGEFHMNGRKIGAHRASYLLAFGPIPEGLLVCHYCDVRLCVNPHHLFLGSCLENMQDRNRKGRQARPKGERHGRAKLSEADARSIKADPRCHKEIARDFGISTPSISLIKTGKRWAHLP